MMDEEDGIHGETYVEENHSNKCFKEMVHLWYNKQFCDVHLMVVDLFETPTTAILAHRIVLAAVIPYFRAMFDSNMKETDQNEVVLHDHNPSTVKTLVEYAYTGKLRVTPETSQDILIAADKFGLQDIVDFCAQHICKQLAPLNCLGIREFAHQQNLTDLYDASSSYVIQNFSAVSREQEFMQLPLDKVEELVQSDDIRVDAEEDVYYAVTEWLNTDTEGREEHADVLYDHVRFPLTPQNFLDNVASKNPYLQTPKGQVYLKDAYEYFENPGVTIFSNPKKTQPRRSVQGIICVVGGVDDGGSTLNQVALYNPHEQVWNEGVKMRYCRSRLGVAMLQGELYAVGGYDLGYSLTTCEKYSPKENRWKPVTDLSSPRRNLALVAVGNQLFAMGGYTGSVYLKSVEIYNPKTDQWSSGPPMLTARSELAAVYLDHRVYAIGGTNSNGHLKSVEIFDCINKRWQSLPDMVSPRTGAAACLLGKDIFVSGGMNEHEISNTCETYDTETGLWDPIICSMAHQRVGLAVVSLANMVYAVGGSNGSVYLESVECFDPSKLQWVESTPLPSPRFGAAAVTLSRKDLIVK
jgi:N-acetylneuraminic acid mutarotase